MCECDRMEDGAEGHEILSFFIYFYETPVNLFIYFLNPTWMICHNLFISRDFLLYFETKVWVSFSQMGSDQIKFYWVIFYYPQVMNSYQFSRQFIEWASNDTFFIHGKYLWEEERNNFCYTQQEIIKKCNATIWRQAGSVVWAKA